MKYLTWGLTLAAQSLLVHGGPSDHESGIQSMSDITGPFCNDDAICESTHQCQFTGMDKTMLSFQAQILNDKRWWPESRNTKQFIFWTKDNLDITETGRDYFIANDGGDMGGKSWEDIMDVISKLMDDLDITDQTLYDKLPPTPRTNGQMSAGGGLGLGCASIGSSGNLLDAGYGARIDEMNLTIRYSGAPAGQKWQEHVGTKTTLRFVYPRSEGIWPLFEQEDPESFILFAPSRPTDWLLLDDWVRGRKTDNSPSGQIDWKKRLVILRPDFYAYSELVWGQMQGIRPYAGQVGTTMFALMCGHLDVYGMGLMSDGSYVHYYHEDLMRRRRSVDDVKKEMRRNPEAVAEFNRKHMSENENNIQRVKRYSYPSSDVKMPLPLLQISDPVSADSSGLAHSSNAQEYLLWFLQHMDWAHVYRGFWGAEKCPDLAAAHADPFFSPQVVKAAVSYDQGGLTIRNTLGPTWVFFATWVSVAFVVALVLGASAGVGFTCLKMKKDQKKKMKHESQNDLM